MALKKIASKKSSALFLVGMAVLVSASRESVSAAQRKSRSAKPGNTTIFLSALDKDGQAVLDLKPEEIDITEKGRMLQTTSMRAAHSEPMRAGILVDVSHSQADSAGFDDPDALSSFIREKLTPGDFTFVVTFSELAYLISDWSNSPPQVGSAVRQALSEPRRGGSAIRDAIYWACNDKLSPHPGNRFVLLLSDMEDNASRHDHDQTIEAALQANAAIYVLWERGARGRNANGEAKRAWREAEKFAEETGGLLVEVRSLKDFRQGLQEINRALAGRYILELEHPSGSLRPGVHKIKLNCSREGVRLLAPGAYFVVDK